MESQKYVIRLTQKGVEQFLGRIDEQLTLEGCIKEMGATIAEKIDRHSRIVHYKGSLEKLQDRLTYYGYDGYVNARPASRESEALSLHTQN